VSGLTFGIGGRSKVGSARLHTLAARGDAVRALVRAEVRAVTLPSVVQPVRGDLADPMSLDAAVDGVEKAFLNCSPRHSGTPHNGQACG
jgi:uncharacterized protein YbjT (DUF2867 family)